MYKVVFQRRPLKIVIECCNIAMVSTEQASLEISLRMSECGVVLLVVKFDRMRNLYTACIYS